MVSFSWTQWLGIISRIPLSNKVRKPRRNRVSCVEGLENRTLLTNNLPVAVNDVYEMGANTALNGQSVLLNDTDADGDTIDQAFINTAPAHGNLSLALNGTFTYTPTNGFVGTDTFSYNARDSLHGESSGNAGIVTIHVGSPNQAPVALNASFTMNVNAVLNGTVSATDANNDPLTISLGSATPAHGNISLSSNGQFTYTPNNGYTGPDSFTFKANDGLADSAQATVSITVGGANTAPVANAVSVTTSVNTVLHGTLTGSDAESDPLTFSAGSTAPAHGSVAIKTDGSFDYTPNSGYTGSDTFTFKVNDGSLNSADAIVTVTVNSPGNSTPVANSQGFATATDTAHNGTLTGSDPDGDSLTFAITVQPVHGDVTLFVNGNYTYTPDAGFNGQDSFDFTVSDGIVTSDPGQVAITVGGIINHLPVAASASQSTNTNTVVNGNLVATDADGDPLTFQLGSVTPSHGSVGINPNGSYAYLPFSGYSGPDSFSFTANDGIGNSNEATISLTVGGLVNAAPVAQAATFSTAAGTPVNGTLVGTDADGDQLTFSVGSIAALHGNVALNSNGSFTYTPTGGFNGNDTFSFKVNDGTVNSSDASVTIHVGTSNTSPVANAVTFNTATNTALNGTVTGSDADGDPLTFVGGTVDPAHGAVTLNLNGTFIYTPANGFTGDDFFTFRTNDGTTNSGEALVTIHVGDAVNTPPVAQPQTINLDVNTIFAGALVGTDADLDPLLFTVGSITAAHGTATIGANGAFTYSPDAGYVGDDLFSFRVNDGTSNSSEALVTIHVNATTGNVAPTVIGGGATATGGVALNGSLAPLGNDLDGDALTFTASTQPGHGVLALSPDGTFVYTPEVGFTGNDTFMFRANDGVQNSNIATFTISVDSAPSDLFTLDLGSTPGTISTSMKTVVPLDPTATVINVDPSVNFAGATINAAITAGADRHDRILVTDGSSIDVRGKKVLFNGTEVARLSGGRRGAALQVNFNSSSTEASVNAVLQRIGLRTTKNAGKGTRTVQITVNSSGTSSDATIDANVV